MIKNIVRSILEFLKKIFTWRKVKKKSVEIFKKKDQNEGIKSLFSDGLPNISYGNNNWKTFQKLLQKAERNIKIITASISFKALDLITSSINKNVEIFILTGRGRNYERIIEIENIKRKNIKGCRGLHSKYAIIDDNIIVIGSSNITKRSLGDIKYEGEFEIDYITDDPVVIRKANQLFEIVWNENENTENLKADNTFISSAYGIPSQLIELIKNSKKNIKIIVPPIFRKSKNFKSIPIYIRELNKDIKIKIITSNKIYEGYLEGLKEIRKLDNYEVILTKNKVHCKVYIFDDEIAIISSVNLYFPQWITSLDSGIIIKEKRIIKELLKIAERLESNQGQLETVQIEYMSQSISTDSLIENISFLFDTEGKKLIPTLRKNHSQPIEEESKTIQSKSKIITKYKQKSNKIEILTNFFGKETIDEEEKELLKIKKLNLIKKLRFYNTNKKEIDLKRNRTSKIIYNLKIIRNDAQWRLKSLKNERENLLRKRDKIKEKISEQKRREELSYYLDNLKEIKMKLKKLWKKHQKYDEKSQKFHKKFIFFLDKKKDLRNKRRELNEKITEIKKELNLLNIKIINYKNEEEIDELDWTIIVEDFYEYILMCPYQKDIEIKWYISDFLTIIGLIPSTKLFFDVLQLGFNSSNPLKIAGKIYNILQLGSPKWGKMFKSSVPGLFKNVLLSQGDSGIEVKDLKEYFKFKEDFENCFAISSPEPREIFNLILKQSKSMKKIISNDVNYKKFCDLFNNCDGFNDFKSEIDKKREGLSAD